MNHLIANFTRQLEEAYQIGELAKLSTSASQISNILISGLGGSGIGGSIVAQLIEKDASVPVNVNKNYFLPQYVNEKTLVIISSYSGNTEEAISCLNQPLKKRQKLYVSPLVVKWQKLRRKNQLIAS